MSEQIDSRWRDVLDFERETGGIAARRATLIRGRFGLSPAGYYQLLNRLIDRPEALAYDPMLVRRLRRLRETRRLVRSGRGAGPER